MKRLIALLAVTLAFACGEAADANEDVELGSATLALETTSATHTYRLLGQLEVWRNGSPLAYVPLNGAATSITVPDLVPGEYGLWLNGPSITRDGVPYPATLVGPNPWSVTVAPGATTNVPISFTVAADPIVVPPVVFDPGALNVSVVVTEVPVTP